MNARGRFDAGFAACAQARARRGLAAHSVSRGGAGSVSGRSAMPTTRFLLVASGTAGV
jgi:hypothetical protein